MSATWGIAPESFEDLRGRRPPGPRDEGPVGSLLRFSASLVLATLVAAIYQTGLVHVAAASFWLEGAITVLLPIALWRFGWLTHGAPRLGGLVVIESFFLAVAFTARLAAHTQQSWLLALTGWGFGLFFVVQIGGFLAEQRRIRSVHGAFQMSCATALIVMWLFSGARLGSTVTPQGHVVVFGSECPFSVRLGYCIWVGGVLLLQSPVVPNMLQLVVHAASVALALCSDAFFHVRLLTAAHLFVLERSTDFLFTLPSGLGGDFGWLPERWVPAYDALRPVIGWTVSVALLALVILTALYGGELEGLRAPATALR